MYSNLNSVSTFNSRETVEVVHTYISSFTLRSTITGKVEFELSKLPRLPLSDLLNDNSNGRIFEQYILLEKIVCILLHSGLYPASDFWLSTIFSYCLKMKSVENMLGCIRGQI